MSLTSTSQHSAHNLMLSTNIHICTACFQSVLTARLSWCGATVGPSLVWNSDYIKSIFWKPLTHLCWFLYPRSLWCHCSQSSPCPFLCLFSPPLPCCLSLRSVFVRDHLTPGQQGSSFLPACLLLLSSFTSWLDHQPCKEDLCPGARRMVSAEPWGLTGEPCAFAAKPVSYTRSEAFVLVFGYRDI